MSVDYNKKQSSIQKGKKNDDFNNDVKDTWWQPSLIIFARMSVWIVAPVITAIFLGRWLDNKYHTEPWLLTGTVIFAFFISMFGLIKESFQEFKKISGKEDKRDKK